MGKRFLELICVAAMIMTVTILLKLTAVVNGQAPTATPKAGPEAKTRPALKTPWGEPNLQGIWTDEYQTPFQRQAKYAGREFLTDKEVADLDRQREKIVQRPRTRPGIGSEADVAGAYDGVFLSIKHTGRRTSLVVDPPDGRIPPVTPRVEKIRAEMRQYVLDTLQATQACKDKERSCTSGTYASTAPKRGVMPPYYLTAAVNRADNPEDRSLGERCMAAQLPDFGGFRRIVQSPGSVSIFYDVGQGQGWQREIPVTGSPHLPPSVRQWWGDSRGHWEGNTLVIDVTNFSGKTNFQGSRENLHLIERWTRTGPDTLEYAVTIDDPTTWTKPWTVKQELKEQDNGANRFYVEPRCHDSGNPGMVGMLNGARVAEKAFAEGKGPDPATIDLYTTGPMFFALDELDPLAAAE